MVRVEFGMSIRAYGSNRLGVSSLCHYGNVFPFQGSQITGHLNLESAGHRVSSSPGLGFGGLGVRV